jgi:hypothetical protein
MPGVLSNIPVTDAQRRAHDHHRLSVVLAVLGMFGLYMYLFTDVANAIDVLSPMELTARLGLQIEHVFGSDGNVDSNVRITQTQLLDSSDDERLVLYVILLAAFLSAYFLPVTCKQPSLVVWTILGILLLYGFRATAGLLFAHSLVYLVLHPDRRRSLWVSGIAGLSLYYTFVQQSGVLTPEPVAFLGTIAATTLLYRYAMLKLLDIASLAPLLRTIAVQSAILIVTIGALNEGLSGDEWSIPLGILLFFWQWERLIMYHVDYKDGLVPKDLSLGKYLAVFLHPGAVPNWTWGVTIGQGYAYSSNNFLCDDKNKLVLAGVRIWGIALIYLVLADWFINLLVELFASFGIPVYGAYTRSMVRHFVNGEAVSTSSVLATTLLDLTRWTMLWAGIVHFKVGIWRICGYRMDPYIRRPWASTNLVTLWSRFAFHYREFLVRAFYYPVFFRCFKRHKALRVFVATMAAAAMGNLIWGHVTERLFYRGLELENLLYALGTWPYFVLLGVGIGLTQVYLLKRKRTRRPWTLDRWLAMDVLCAYCTLQFFALIHIFARPVAQSSPSDLFALFVRAFGVSL